MPQTSARKLSEVEPGIWQDVNGRFHAAGYSYSTIEQARFHAARQWRGGAQPEPRPQVREIPRAYDTPRFSRTEPPAAKSMVGERERWIGAATTVRVNGIIFDAVLTYVGVAKDKYAYPPNSALIDPNLSVGHDGDPYGSTLDYWPDYARLNPRARRTYLEWLASGRRDPNIPIGYVFVYFYGLERRLVFDRSDADVEPILAELRGLLAIYGNNHSFSRYATGLIEFVQPLRGIPEAPLVPSLERRSDYELPLGVRVSLGRLLENKQPLDADQALCWLLLLPHTYARTPAQRCFEELKALWRIRFAEAYPEGLRIRAPKTQIKVYYRSAGRGYQANAEVPLPDIGQVAGPIPKLRELLSTCTCELDALSRFLGRMPDGRGSLEATLLLPSDLRVGPLGAGAQKCIDLLHQKFDDSDRATLDTSELLSILELERPEPLALPAQLVRQVGSMLDALDVGFEPDRRYGVCGALATDTSICIFRAPAGGPVAASVERYVAARTLTEIAALAATADGVVVPLEVEAIERDLASLDLSTIEQARLLAHAEAILRNPPKARAAIKRLLALPEERRHRIAQSAITAVLADGQVLPSEVRFLEGLYKALGFPNEDIYTQLHRGSVEIDEPVTVAKAVGETGVPLPDDPVADGSVTVDAARLERIRRETSQVSSLLSTIFVDDGDALSGATTASSPAEADRFAGLGHAHGELLALLLSAPMERSEFEEAARARKLMPEGALETINDWSFDQFDEPAVEDEDMILVAAHLIQPIKALEKAA